MTTATDDILDYFKKISAIPRRSKEEDKIRNWIISWAEEHGFSHRTDQIGNLCCYVPGKGKFENHEPIAIQGHLDMVCEKESDSSHDFSKDGIELIVDGDWLKAHKTTLGADNGIAIAMAMKVANDSSVEHPPLELLFTIDEETGLTGALQLDPSLLSAKTLLNIDSEDEGVFTIGCAGGNTATLRKKFSKETYDGDFFAIKGFGMKGGHSGVDIHLQRANALRVVNRVFSLLKAEIPSLRMASLEGGNAHNAIPREATAIVAVAKGEGEKLQQLVIQLAPEFQKEFASSDPELNIVVASTSQVEVLREEDSQSINDLVMMLPHGVVTMSLELKGIVETSSNLAQISMRDDHFEILTSQRSSVSSRLVAITDRLKSLARLGSAELEVLDGYPAWEPNWQSPIIEKAVSTYKSLFDKDPVVEIIHAGLECGIIGEKVPGMQMISFGPTIVDPHSPQERLKISDVDKVWKLLVGLLQTV